MRDNYFDEAIHICISTVHEGGIQIHTESEGYKLKVNMGDRESL